LQSLALVSQLIEKPVRDWGRAIGCDSSGFVSTSQLASSR
jgi:hypothetical protein